MTTFDKEQIEVILKRKKDKKQQSQSYIEQKQRTQNITEDIMLLTKDNTEKIEKLNN